MVLRREVFNKYHNPDDESVRNYIVGFKVFDIVVRSTVQPWWGSAIFKIFCQLTRFWHLIQLYKVTEGAFRMICSNA
jgi:hypothetical protein